MPTATIMPRGWRRLAGAALALALLAGCESAADRAAGHMARGLELVAAGQDDKARLEFANVLRILPDDVAAHLQMARLYERTGQPRQMFGHVSRLVELSPGDVWVRSRMAEFMLAGGDPDAALSHAEAAVAAGSGQAEPLAIRAAVHFAMGRTEAALADAQAALSIDPGQPLAGQVVVRERLVARDPEAALAAADGFLVRHPDDPELNRLRLAILAQTGRTVELGPQIGIMTRLAPDDIRYWTMLVQWHAASDDIAGAFDRLAARVAQPANQLFDQQLAELAILLAQEMTRREGAEAARARLARLGAVAARPDLFARLLAAFDLANGREAEGIAALEAMIAGPDAGAAAAARIMLARIRLGAGDRDAARALIEATLAADARNTEALTLRAALALDEGRIEPAQTDLRLAMTESPQNPTLLTLSARAHLLSGNRILAEEALAAAMQAAGYAPAESLRYAGFLVEDGRAGPAETVLSEAVRRHPADRALLVRLAELRLMLGKAAEAAELADRLAALEGEAALATRIRAAALYGQQRYDESVAILERLAADPAERDRTLAGLVQGYVAANQRAKAEALLATLLAEEPGNLQALLLSAGFAEGDGRTAEALALIARAVAAAPADPRGHEALVAFHRRQGNPAAATQALEAGLAAIPDAPGLTLIEATFHEEAGRIDAAIAAYERVLAVRPDALVAVNNYVSLVTDHYPDDAARLERVRLMAAPLRISRIPHFQDTYGWLLYLAGDVQGALELLVPAAEALPDNPWVRYHLGMALARAGQAATARGHLEAALSLAGTAPFAAAGRIRDTLAGLGG